MKQLNKMNQYNPGAAPTGGRLGDPKPTPVRPLRPDIERTTLTTDPGVSGSDRGYPSMYELARSLTKGKWGNSAT